MGKIEDILNITQDGNDDKRKPQVPAVRKAKKKDSELLGEILESAKIEDVIESDDIASVEINAKKAAELNVFVQTRLADVFQVAFDTAEQLARHIKAGDVDARQLEGTARLIDAGTRALTEMNQYNMFLQKSMLDTRLAREMDKLQQQLQNNRQTISREAVLSIVKEVDETEEQIFSFREDRDRVTEAQAKKVAEAAQKKEEELAKARAVGEAEEKKEEESRKVEDG